MESYNDAGLRSRADHPEESFGPYRLVEKIGQGALAEVFKAKSFGVEGFEKVLAIKRVFPELSASEPFVARFVHEAQHITRLSHANIVQVFDLGKIQAGALTHYFIAMELVAGLPLALLLERSQQQERPLPFLAAAYLASEIAKGLDHAHRRRDEQMRRLAIVHGDLRPENVLLSFEGEVKIADFGVGRASSAVFEAGDESSGIVRRPKHAHKSPEQLAGGTIDSRSDLFSLGSLLYEAIGGVHPFRAATADETIERVRAEELPPLERLREGVPEKLAQIVGRALAKEPARRYPDAGAMHQDLLAFLYSSKEAFGPNELAALVSELREPPPRASIEKAPPREPLRSVPKPQPPEEVRRGPGDALRLTKFVGRREELQRLGELFALSTRRKVQIVTIRGERGMGKSRLLKEVERRLGRGQLDVAMHVVLCRDDASKEPLAGIALMLRDLFGMRDEGDVLRPYEVAAKVRGFHMRDEETRAIEMLLGASFGEVSLPHLGSAMARIVTKLSEEQLHIFAWDRADALDAESLTVLDLAVQRMAYARAVFVLLGSPRLKHELSRLSSHHEIVLGPLDDAEVEQLVLARTGLRQMPKELLAFCRERASGHPMFVEEILRELVVSESVVIENGGLLALRSEAMAEVPDHLSSLLSRRIARLMPNDREILTAAAVLGDPMSTKLLAAMLSLAPSALDESLSRLEALHLLHRDSQARLSFATALVPELILDDASIDDLRRLNAQAASAYERTHGERLDERAARIGAHLVRAKEEDRAASYFVRSGRHRANARQWEASARDFKAALTLLEPRRHEAEDLAKIIEGLALAIYKVRSVEDFADAAEPLLEQIDKKGERAARIEARVHLARALGATSAFDEAEEYLEEARNLDPDHPRVLHAEGELAFRRGEFGRAHSFFERLRASDAAPESATSELEWAVVLSATGQSEEAFLAMQRSETLASEEDLASEAEQAKLRGLVRAFAGDFIEAARELERSIELLRYLGLGCEMAVVLHCLGEALLRMGDLPRAYASFQQATSSFDRLGEERLGFLCRGSLAHIDGLNGAPAAERTLNESIGYASVHGLVGDEISGRHWLGLLYERNGNSPAARAELQRARELSDGVGYRRMRDDCEAALERLS